MSHTNTSQNASALAQAVTSALEKYFTELNGETASGVYDMVLSCVERPMLEVVMTSRRQQPDGCRTDAGD